ncbi:hypothetical protein MKW98_010761 [Papaver atlanticum]|uniref:Uncharacterized protein n=2 Tax=Magnoliopsida TaxID=3398 RepID=A0AAD4SLV5_9MAGN|nr:hypothetical protein MKW98_010761 [Papaver atlanticum]
MGRSPCCEKAHTNKGAWTKEEDDRLIAHIRAHGEGCWRSLPKAAGLLRCGKSCRLRWINYLRPDLKRGNFTEEEDELIIKLHSLLGNKWSLIAGRLKGRTDNEIKNYWNTHIRRKLMSRGVDPTTHRPINTTTNIIDSSSVSDHNLHHGQVKTISFSTSKEEEEVVEEQKDVEDIEEKMNKIVQGFDSHKYNNHHHQFYKKEEKINSITTMVMTQDHNLQPKLKCPDLNLELRISPPYQNPAVKPLLMKSTTLCFTCNLGLQNKSGCNCSGNSSTSSINSSGSSGNNELLGLSSGILSFRS